MPMVLLNLADVAGFLASFVPICSAMQSGVGYVHLALQASAPRALSAADDHYV